MWRDSSVPIRTSVVVRGSLTASSPALVACASHCVSRSRSSLRSGLGQFDLDAGSAQRDGAADDGAEVLVELDQNLAQLLADGDARLHAALELA